MRGDYRENAFDRRTVGRILERAIPAPTDERFSALLERMK